MSGFSSIIKKFLKVILWTMAGLIFVFLLFAALIQFPSIQNKLVDIATSYVSRTTNTKAEIGNISIAFPHTIVVKDIFLEDNHQDTLLFAGKTSLNIRFKALMKQRLHIHDFLLQDVYLNVYNSETDSLFNYQFLIDAFSDTTLVKKDTTETTINWTVYAEKFRLKNIRLRYADEWNKLKATTQLQLFELGETNIRFDTLTLDIKNIVLKANKLHYLSGEVKTESNQFNPDDIGLNRLNLKARNLSFAPGKTYIEIQQLAVEEQHGMSIRKFAMLFNMDNKLTNINNLTLQTQQSSIEADISLQYPSLATLTDSLSKLWIEVHIRQASFSKDEIKRFAGYAIPENIDIPNQLNLKANFSGRIDAFDASLILDSDFGGATLLAVLRENEQYDINLAVLNFDAGKVLKDSLLFGPVSLVAQVQGKGFDMQTAQLQIMTDVSQAYFNQYNYQRLSLNGNYSQQLLEGSVRMRDENIRFDLDGLANLAKGKEAFQFELDLIGIDFHALKFMEDDLRVACKVKADINGLNPAQINGTLNLHELSIVQNNKTYALESLALETKNAPGKNEFNLRSALIDLSYDGNISPVLLPEILTPFISKYLSNEQQLVNNKEDAAFDFKLNIHDHPLLTEFLVPGLDVFVPDNITGNFDNKQQTFNLQAGISKTIYNGIQIEDLQFNVNANADSLLYALNIRHAENEQIQLDNLYLGGTMQDQSITALLSAIDEDGNKHFVVDSRLQIEPDVFRLHFNPDNFFVMNKQWSINPEHYIAFGNQGFLVHNLQMQHEEELLSIHSVNEKFNDDISIQLQQFSLYEISRIIDNENTLIGGMLNGDILLKKTADSYGIIADANIDKLVLMDVPIGNLNIAAKNPVANRFDVQGNIEGGENNLTLAGHYTMEDDNQSIDLKANIQSLSMKTLEAFSAGQLAASKGILAGYFDVSGKLNKPNIAGELTFQNVETTPAFLNNRIALSNETIRMDNKGIYFDGFTIKDVNDQPASIHGALRMQDFADLSFDLRIDANHFQLFNTTAKDNDLFYGRMLIDSKIHITGPLELPVVNATLKLKQGSHVSFIVPRTELNTYKGEDVVVFETRQEEISITERDKQSNTGNMQFRGVDLTAILEVDKNATLRLFMDPSSSDSLVVKGQADLNLTMDRSGKMSLTGSYNIEEGSYQLTFESIIRKKFDIVQGSTIVWNGDPMDANVNINAAYNVRTAPYNLVADQLGGLTDIQKRPYLQAYPFILLLKMRGELLQPEIGFEIQLPTENQQILGGTVQQKLNQLNEDPSALNKQVFALLLLNRFAQDNPLQTESAGTPAMLRSTVSNFLSEQLNKLSASFIPGLEMNFNLQSYEEYTSGDAEGRTELTVGVKKELFDERLSVQVGGSVDLEGEKATQNQANDIASDVVIEYKLTKDGRYRLKGFRKNQYEGLIDGQLTETGVGAVLVREFNRLKELFKKANNE